MRKFRLRTVVAVILAAGVGYLLFSPAQRVITEPAPAGTNAFGRPLHWFKGNTHAHARISVAGYTHGDSTREEVVKWYHDHGYHFVSVTDHNRYTDAGDLSLPRPLREDFLLVPGMEVTSDHRYPGVMQEGERKIHLTAFNTARPVEWTFDDPGKAAIINIQARRIAQAGGVAILNHPNYRFQVELQDVLDSPDIRHMEIANVHPRSNHSGHAGFRPAVEELWDQALSNGKLLYGVASDDAHDFGWYQHALRVLGMAPPGGGWIMVGAPELSAAALASALQAGDFYATTGVHLKRVATHGEYYEIEVDMVRTRYEAGHRWIRDAAPVVDSDDSHFVIEFIGAYGRVLHSVHGQPSARFRLDGSPVYVRGRVTYLEKKPASLGRNRARAFYAWTQPVMTPPAHSTD